MIERKFIEDNIRKVKLEAYFKKELNRAGFTELEINKTPLVTRIILNVAKPGLAIGKGGKNIKIITDEMKEKFGIENPQIEINEIKNPFLDAKATTDKLVKMLERGYSWRSVIFRTMESIMEAGAEGAELVIKGKLTGKGGRKARNRIVKGYMKKVGNQVKLVDSDKGAAYLKAGAIGIKLSIVRPNTMFPDKIKIKEYIEKHRTAIEEMTARNSIEKAKEDVIKVNKSKVGEKPKTTEKEQTKKEKPKETKTPTEKEEQTKKEKPKTMTENKKSEKQKSEWLWK